MNVADPYLNITLVCHAVVFLPWEHIIKSQCNRHWPGKASFSAFHCIHLILSTDYWPLSVRVCGFWFLPNEWQFSCNKCGDNSFAGLLGTDDSHTCSNHTELYTFISSCEPALPIFVGLSSVGRSKFKLIPLNQFWLCFQHLLFQKNTDIYSVRYLTHAELVYGSNVSLCFCSMGFVRDPIAFLRILQSVIQITGYRFIIFTAGYGPLDAAIWTIANRSDSSEKQPLHVGISIFNGKLFCYSGWAQICLIFSWRLFT